MERRSFERISRHCEDSEKGLFPMYLGTVELSRPHTPLVYLVFPKGIVMEPFRFDLKSRYLHPAALPEYLLQETREFREQIPLPDLEAEWCLSLLGDRLLTLTKLHELAIIHGDIEERHFRLPGDFHDTLLHDFSNSYTFTTRYRRMIERVTYERGRV